MGEDREGPAGVEGDLKRGRSADELRIQLEDAKALLSEAFEELKKVELLDERDQMRERAEVDAREQAELDAIGLMRTSARA